jgi:hypothetical protein
MNRLRTGTILTSVTAVLFAATGALHLSAFGAINGLAASATPADVHVLLPALWIAVGVDLVAAGLVIAAVAIERSTGGGLVLAATAIIPLGGVVIHLVYFGFLAPTALLLADGVLAIACAVIRGRV